MDAEAITSLQQGMTAALTQLDGIYQEIPKLES